MEKGSLDISLYQMQIFFKVAEEQSFSEAAQMLYISQSTVSKAIAKLEEELEIRLFERTTRRIKLTEPGKLLYFAWKEQVERIWHIYDQARQWKES